MSLVSALLLSSVPIGILLWIGRRDHWTRQHSRRGLLDDCIPLFDRYELTHGDDNFPRLSGRSGTRKIDIRLLSDTMTIRRLPQLWLQVTVLEHLPDVSGFAILVRPSGYDFYSLTAGFHHVIEPPPSLPQEILARGEDARSVRLFEKLAPTLASILSDPLVKEVAVTSKGLRIIRQNAEGRRGDYLLLRQAVFDDAMVSAETLATTLEQIQALRDDAVTPARGVKEPV